MYAFLAVVVLSLSVYKLQKTFTVFVKLGSEFDIYGFLFYDLTRKINADIIYNSSGVTAENDDP